MATRGKTYYEMHGDIKLEFADRHLQLLKEYARCYTSDVPSLKELGLRKLRAVAEVLAQADRDRVNQIIRRKDKPSGDGYDTDRNERIRRRYKHLVEGSLENPIATLHVETGLSTRQLSRIVNAKTKPKKT